MEFPTVVSLCGAIAGYETSSLCCSFSPAGRQTWWLSNHDWSSHSPVDLRSDPISSPFNLGSPPQ
uniref:Uncharacterized protein n=1 Tax=Kalanchoe fedtschenkoi TaxID=63787 RepID=A0A7N0TAB0_KALFE